MDTVRGGVTAPEGFLAAGVSCAIKRRGKDLALIVSRQPAAIAGSLTTNALRAPCVQRAERLLKKGLARGIVANSGNANCCTGRQGVRDNDAMARLAAEAAQIPAEQVFTASTGVIGKPLPMPKIRQGIRQAGRSLSRTGSLSTAEAILTTDTRAKEFALRFKIGGVPVTVGGIAKGSGMIAPNMATLLAFLTTDAKVSAGILRMLLKELVPQTFNSITVDGEMSTNDMVLLMANGASGAPAIRLGTTAFWDFARAVGLVCRHLAHEIARDGEGVTRLFTVQVTGAPSEGAARKVARQIGNSLLVKTMVAGRDPNWGRVAAAVGASGVAFKPNRLTLKLGHTVVFRKGEAVRVRHEKLLEEVDRPEVRIGVDLGNGRHQTQLLSTDLTEDYIRINAKYTT